jgi:hypothetical protein
MKRRFVNLIYWGSNLCSMGVINLNRLEHRLDRLAMWIEAGGILSRCIAAVRSWVGR